MKGISQERINQAKEISLKGYLSDKHPDMFRVRSNGCLVYKKDPSIVIYDDHSYTFSEVVHPYKDNIGTLREIFGYGFVETVEMLERWRDEKDTEPMQIDLFLTATVEHLTEPETDPEMLTIPDNFP